MGREAKITVPACRLRLFRFNVCDDGKKPDLLHAGLLYIVSALKIYLKHEIRFDINKREDN